MGLALELAEMNATRIEVKRKDRMMMTMMVVVVGFYFGFT